MHAAMATWIHGYMDTKYMMHTYTGWMAGDSSNTRQHMASHGRPRTGNGWCFRQMVDGVSCTRRGIRHGSAAALPFRRVKHMRMQRSRGRSAVGEPAWARRSVARHLLFPSDCC